MQAGIDVGGTFTDLAMWSGDGLITRKVPTTPADQSRGVAASLDGLPGVRSLVHGTTVATNALLERSGARTVLVTDRGFEDLIEIGRQDRPSLYDLHETRPAPLVGPNDRIGIEGRGDASRPPEHALADLVARVRLLDPRAVAISTLFSFLDDGPERAMADALREALPDVAVSVSSEVAPEFREYERASTTIINAYLIPLVADYLRRLDGVAMEIGLSSPPAVMRSSGGLVGLSEAARLPASIVLSGPAGGVVAAAEFGAVLGHQSVISFDMGGTSTDVCRVESGRPEVAFQQIVAGLPNRMPSVAVHTVGAGGGSIGWIDPGGALRVGPRSAGADPGPASYGLGGSEPTVTDADLLLGRLAGGSELGGAMTLRADLARTALARVGEGLDLTAEEVALGMIAVVEAHMERAIRVVSVEQGADPRDAVLVAFGGAGGLHATAVARSLGMSGVVVPPHSGVLSALGLLLAPPRADLVRGGFVDTDEALARGRDDLVDKARSRLGAGGAEVRSEERHADVRYLGQAHELSVPVDPGLSIGGVASRFHELHHERNGFARVDDPVEIVALRAVATGAPAVGLEELPQHEALGTARRPARPILTRDGQLQAAVVWRSALAPGQEVVGPMIVEDSESTTFLAPGERGIVHPTGALMIEW